MCITPRSAGEICDTHGVGILYICAAMLNMALAMLLLLGVAFMPTLANCVDLAVASTEEATMEATPHMGHIDVPHARRTAPPVDVDGVE